MTETRRRLAITCMISSVAFMILVVGITVGIVDLNNQVAVALGLLCLISMGTSWLCICDRRN